jgi:hypothetical protein
VGFGVVSIGSLKGGAVKEKLAGLALINSVAAGLGDG